jgi:hypothetical protein
MPDLKKICAALNEKRDDDKDYVTLDGQKYKTCALPAEGTPIDDTANVWSWNETHRIVQKPSGVCCHTSGRISRGREG